MSHLLRPASEKTFRAADAQAGTPRCLLILEAALQDLISDPYDELRRKYARETVRTLSAGCEQCGFHGSHVTIRKIEALLRVPPKAAPELEKQIGDKLLELVGILKAQALEKTSEEKAGKGPGAAP